MDTLISLMLVLFVVAKNKKMRNLLVDFSAMWSTNARTLGYQYWLITYMLWMYRQLYKKY